MAAQALTTPVIIQQKEEEEILNLKNNPLLQDFVFPPFDAIEAKHVCPGIRALLKELENDLIELEKTVKPTWPDLVDPLEKIVDRLEVVWRVVNLLKSVKDSPELRMAIEEVQADKVQFDLRVAQSEPIYDAFRLIHESSDWETLSDTRKCIVEYYVFSPDAEIHETRWFWRRTKTALQRLLSFQLSRPTGRVFFGSHIFCFSKFLHLSRTFVKILRHQELPFFRVFNQPNLLGRIKEAIFNCVPLKDEKLQQLEQLNELEQELDKLSEKCEENLLDATKKFQKIITDKSEIEGLPASALGLAAQTAVSKGHENATAEDGPWIITMDAPCYNSVVQHACNRSLREEVYRAFATLASNGDLDNTPIIDQILKLRLEKAKLCGYKNYAELRMSTKTATLYQVEELLEKLHTASWKAAVQDMEDLQNFARDQGAVEANDLRGWDIAFWSERLRESKYDINEEELRSFFSLPKVMDGLFKLAKKLFEIDIDAADGIAPVWNKDVKFYRVKDGAGKPIAYLYFDPYSRPSEKREGAWMNEVVGRSRALARKGDSTRLPVLVMVCNQTPPVGNKPSLMTFDEVETIFHEFGHALQHMLAKEDEGLASDTRWEEEDAVELPSQFMENWCYHRDTFMSIAKHYETGETLSEEVYKRLVAAKTFQAGLCNLSEIIKATIDLELHKKYVPGGTESIHDIERRVCERTQIIPLLPESMFLCGFDHIFSGDYAAGYYSYQWAEVLSADAFSAFEDAGLDNEKALKEMGRKFRETILACGGTKSPLEAFVEFRGREPSPEALLRHNGLLTATQTPLLIDSNNGLNIPTHLPNSIS